MEYIIFNDSLDMIDLRNLVKGKNDKITYTKLTPQNGRGRVRITFS